MITSPARPASPAIPKGHRTRTAILEAAARLFSQRGFDGTGIRDIEDAAGVNRGVVTYHFGNKEDIWKAVVDFLFEPYIQDLRSKRELILALEPAARRRFLIGHFVRTSAQRPEMNHLMIQENLARSPRLDWIIERYLRPLGELHRELSNDDPALRAVETDPHLRYALLGACVHVFALAGEVDALYNRDVFDEQFVEGHIRRVIALIERHDGRESV
jgi:TetR/AcrR family transcriptional regulator